MPTSGISSSEEANVPTSDPTVEIAYIRPAVSPDPSTLRNFNRIAHGDTAPNINTGAATSANTPNNDPRRPRPTPVKRLHRRQERIRDHRHQPQQHGGHHHQPTQRPQIPDADPPTGPRTNTRRTAPRTRPRSCSPTRSSTPRRTAPSTARPRSPPPAWRCRRRRRGARAEEAGAPDPRRSPPRPQSSYGLKSALRAPADGAVPIARDVLDGVPGGIPPSGSPSAGS